MLSRVLVLLFPLAALGAEGTYSYDRCNTAAGPAAWSATYCQAQIVGTPIDLCGATTFSAGPPALQPTSLDEARTMQISTDGFAITVKVSEGTVPQLSAGNLSQVVGLSSNSTDITWKLEQMHIHWGRNGRTGEGSEHFLQGQQYAMEAHLVHYNSDFNGVAHAVGSGRSDALLVVGVMFEAGAVDDSHTIAVIAAAAPTVTKTPTDTTSTVQLSDVFDGTGSYYSYAGSLTTPVCSPVVTWVVMSSVKTISFASLENLYGARNPANNSNFYNDYGNYRPLQTLGSRTLYFSNGTTAACGPVQQPNFGCSAGLTTMADAQTFITETYFQTIFTYMGVVMMTAADRLRMATAITHTDIISVVDAVYAYVLCTSDLLLPILPGSSSSSISQIKVKSWGQGATKGVFMSYPITAAGFNNMNVPFSTALTYLFLFSVDRMDDSGNLKNNNPFIFEVTTAIVNGVTIRAFNSDLPNGADVTSIGGTVTYVDSGNTRTWTINAPHTSAFTASVMGSMMSPSPTSGSGSSSDGNSSSDGLWGLFALLILPFIAIAICFWGYKALKPKGVEAQRAPYPSAVGLQSYPYGMPVSPVSKWDIAYPALSAYPATSAPLPYLP